MNDHIQALKNRDMVARFQSTCTFLDRALAAGVDFGTDHPVTSKLEQEIYRNLEHIDRRLQILAEMAAIRASPSVALNIDE